MSPIQHKSVNISHILQLVLGVTFLALGLMYVMFQARLFISGPEVSLSEEPNVVQSERRMQLTGMAKNITRIYLNGRPISTNEAGTFSESVILENGQTVVRIDAEDRYGRQTNLERSFVYKPTENININ